jgi:hypothetical protein
MAVLKKTSSFVVQRLELLFYKWGCFVSRHPAMVIVGCLLITALASLGCLNLRSESKAEKLWIPSHSSYIRNKHWLDQNFPQYTRWHSALFVASDDNILSSQYLLQMLELHEKIEKIQSHNQTWKDFCYRVPIADIFLKRKKRESEDYEPIVPLEGVFNTSILVNQAVKQFRERSPKSLNDLNNTEVSNKEEEEESSNPWGNYDSDYGYYYDDYPEEESPPSPTAAAEPQITISSHPTIYCHLIETLDEKCLVSSILELWKFDSKIIAGLTQQDIITAVNNVTKSPMYGYNFDYASLLGDIKRDITGDIISAKSANHAYVTKINPDAIALMISVQVPYSLMESKWFLVI